VKNEKTPVIVERVVADIDEIVRSGALPRLADTSAGEREVKKALRKSLLKYQLHQDAELFERAYGYIRQYAAPGLRHDQAGGPQATDDPPDHHRAGVDARRQGLRGQPRRRIVLGDQRQAGQHVGGDGEAAVGHGGASRSLSQAAGAEQRAPGAGLLFVTREVTDKNRIQHGYIFTGAP
jgi:hypothetical protein